MEYETFLESGGAQRLADGFKKRARKGFDGVFFALVLYILFATM